MTRIARWKILTLSFLAIALTGPGQTIGVSVFVDSIIADLGLSRSQVSGAYLVGTVIGAIALPSIGRAIDRYGAKNSMVAIGVAFALGIAVVSRSWSLATLAVGFTLIRMFGQGSLTLVTIVGVTKRIIEDRGAALGLLSSTGGALLGLVPLGLNLLIEWTDWRTAWLISGGLVLVAVPTIATYAFGGGPARANAPAGAIDVAADESVDRSAAVRTYRFWVLGAASAATAMFVTALNFHQISLLGEAGLTAAEAAAMFVPQVLGTAFAGYLFGWLSDRWPAQVLIAISMTLLATAMALTSVLQPGPVIVLYSLVLGTTGGSLRSVGSAVPPRWFGIHHIGAIQGVLTFVGVLGSAAGPLYLSAGRDWAGDYRSIVVLSIVVPVAIGVASAWVKDSRPAPAFS